MEKEARDHRKIDLPQRKVKLFFRARDGGVLKPVER